MTMKSWQRLTVGAAAAALLVGTMSSGALAFSDIEGVPQANTIMELKERGVVGGFEDGTFAPRAQLSAQQAIPLIVRAMELSLAKFTFIKQPLASDSFTNIPNDAWYAEAFVIAHVNGLPIDREIDPNAPVSRELFVQWLTSAVETTGDYARIQLYLTFEDEAAVSEGCMAAVQAALIDGIAELDEAGSFRPQNPVTRAEAADMAAKAVNFVEKMRAIDDLLPPVADPIAAGDVAPSVAPVNDAISKIVLDMGERPHPGWGVRIEGIDFLDDDSAVVRYSVSYPNPAALYPMVITHPTAETYLASQYTDIQYSFVYPPSPMMPSEEPPSDVDVDVVHPAE